MANEASANNIEDYKLFTYTFLPVWSMKGASIFRNM
mgnify:FL=1